MRRTLLGAGAAGVSMDEVESTYRAWLAATHGPAHARRTADRNAAFLLPHLQPGMRLLDVGCGPGSITIGLAQAVAPAPAIGIDRSADAVRAAAALAFEHGLAKVRFLVADAVQLPFDDASLDVAFAHTLLQHLEQPLDALREVHRVLKPEGMIAVADADFDGALVAPPDPLLQRGAAVIGHTRRNPRIGKHLRELLHAAGFRRTEASVAAQWQGDEVSARLAGEWNARYFESPAFIAQAEIKGWSTAEEMRAIAAAWRAWAASPGAFSAALWCQALGWK